MIERAASLALVTHILCWTWAMCFPAATSSENDQGSMNFASKTAPLSAISPSSVAPIQRSTGCKPALDAFDRLPGVALESIPVESFRHYAELDDEVSREVLRLDF